MAHLCSLVPWASDNYRASRKIDATRARRLPGAGLSGPGALRATLRGDWSEHRGTADRALLQLA